MFTFITGTPGRRRRSSADDRGHEFVGKLQRLDRMCAVCRGRSRRGRGILPAGIVEITAGRRHLPEHPGCRRQSSRRGPSSLRFPTKWHADPSISRRFPALITRQRCTPPYLRSRWEDVDYWRDRSVAWPLPFAAMASPHRHYRRQSLSTGSRKEWGPLLASMRTKNCRTR